MWEGWRCRLSQGWQLGAVLTCSLIKSSWARVHLWQCLCLVADRWEGVLNTSVEDRQEMPPCCADNICNSLLNMWYDRRRGVCGSMFTFTFFIPWEGVQEGLLWFASDGTQLDKVFCAGSGDSMIWGRVSQSLNPASVHLYQNRSAHRSSEGGTEAPSKMGHRLSALQQKLNLTNCLHCIEPCRDRVDLQTEQPRHRNICEQYPE